MNKKIFENIIYNSVITGYIIIILSFFGAHFYFFDLFSHFYLQYFIIGLILFISSLIIKNKYLVSSCLIVLIFLGVNIGKSTIYNKFYFGKSDIFYMNANYLLSSPEDIVDEIKKYKPDYLILLELNEELYNKIQDNFHFKNTVYLPDNLSSFGFFTNNEILDTKIHKLTYPIGEIKTQKATIYITHPFPPTNRELAELQKKNFEELTNLYKNNPDTKKLIIGDFNSSFYSKVFKNYFKDMYYNPIYTWSTKSFLRLPLDYAIGNYDFFEAYGISFYESDHIPLVINFKN